MPTNRIEWLRGTFEKLDMVEDVEIDGFSMLITRTEQEPVRLGFVSETELESDEVDLLLEAHPDVSFVVNIPRESRIMGDALEFAAANGVGIGGVADAMRALRLDDPTGYEHPELTFVLEGLMRHGRVREVQRMDDRRLLIQRHGRPEIVAFIAPEYQPTGASVRKALTYGDFDVFVATNPNSDPTGEAIAVAARAGRSVQKWGPFLSSLSS